MKHFSENLAPSRQRLGCFILLAIGCVAFLTDASATKWQQETLTAPSIRAAQLFTQDGGWTNVVARSAGDERAEIRAHFAAVSRILVENEPTSLRIAAARFEQAFGLSLTRADRAVLLSKLAARRVVQLQRLADYANAGRFPLNRHYPGEARPIFVDARGTHCAVGHLMAMDGWEDDVIAIARAKPNVLVREIVDGPLVSWLLTSGLIQEEAALIQPGYYPPSADAVLSTLVVPGASLDRAGFRYENFSFSASSTGGAVTPTAAQFGIAYGWPPVPTIPGHFCGNYTPVCVPRLDAFWIGVYQSPGWTYLPTGADQSIIVEIDYDVVPVAAELTIVGARTFHDFFYGGLNGASVATVVDGDTSGLLELLVTGQPPFQISDRDSALFNTPASRVHVQHSIQIANGAGFTSFDSMVLRPGNIDTDADEIVDGLDNCTLVVNQDQFDGDGDGYGNYCDGDLSNNGSVNAQDYAMFRSKLGTADAAADLNHNFTVNAQDYAMFRSLLGSPPGPSGLHP